MNSTNSSADLASLRQEMGELRASLAAIRSNGHGPGSSFLAAAESNHATDRRSMLKTVGAMAAGVAAVGLLSPTKARAGFNRTGKGIPEATGGNLIIGSFNAPTNPADVTGLINPGSVLFPLLLRVDNYSSGGFVTPASSFISIVGAVNDAGATPTGQTYYGVYGQAQSTSGAARGVYGLAGTIASPSGIGVSGVGGVGVLGTGAGSGCGVDGVINSTSAAAFAVRGTASNAGRGGAFFGGTAAILVGQGSGAVINPNASPPSGGSAGDLYVGSDSSLWYNSGGTNPYRKLAGSATAGAVHILATPVRYVDTRNGTGGATAPYSNGEVRSYNFISLQAGTIPQGARGIFGNLTAASPTGNGNYQTNTVNSFPAGSAAVMSFTPNVNLSNHFVSALDSAGNMFVRANVLNGGGTVHLVLDIQGYYV